MPVYELKDHRTLSRSTRPKPILREIAPAVPVYESKAISHLFKRHYPESRDKRRREAVKLSEAGVRDVKRLAEQVNSRLEKSGAGIHLMLVQDGDGFALDVYDCTADDACRVVHDMVVRVDELQSLFAKLQKESGLIFDESF